DSVRAGSVSDGGRPSLTLPALTSNTLRVHQPGPHRNPGRECGGVDSRTHAPGSAATRSRLIHELAGVDAFPIPSPPAFRGRGRKTGQLRRVHQSVHRSGDLPGIPKESCRVFDRNPDYLGGGRVLTALGNSVAIANALSIPAFLLTDAPAQRESRHDHAIADAARAAGRRVRRRRLRSARGTTEAGADAKGRGLGGGTVAEGEGGCDLGVAHRQVE